MVHLLDVDPDLASRLRDDDRSEARARLTLSTTTVPAGAWALTDEDPRGHPLGVVVLDGLLQRDVRLAGRSSLQLLGPGDLVLPADDSTEFLTVDVRWQAAVDTRVALLDDRLQGPLALWPGIALGLLERAAEQLTRLALQSAIAHLPRVEDRLEATFWDLAERWGRVGPSGIHLPLQLTHEVLARLVGGRRPTISLALAALAERAIVVREPDGSWLVVARAPSLVAGDTEAAPRVSVTAEADTGPAPPATAWRPEARAELLATARRVREDCLLAVERIAADRSRYELTRRRSAELRDRTLHERAKGAARRAREAPFSARVPAGPSAG